MIPVFALRLICGLAIAWCTSPRELITSGFFRIQMLVTLGLSVLTVLTAGQIEDSTSSLLWYGGLGLAVLSFLGSVMWTLERRAAGFRYAVGIMIAAAALIVTQIWMRNSDLWFQLADGLSSAWMIGSVTATMLLGHWYLTATGMKLLPLQRMNLWFMAAVVLRAVVIAIALATSRLTGGMTLWVLRWAGLIGPIVVSVLTIQILKYRNTQSATGVLYAATTLVFMGEAAGVLLQSGSES